MQPSPSENQLLKHCPWCDYNLTGLPADYVCPECGHPVNRRTLVIGRRAGKLIRNIFLEAALVSAILLFTMLIFGGQVTVSLLVMYIVVWLIALIAGLSRYGTTHRLVIADEGLTIERYSRQPEHIPWSRVKGADQGWNKRILRVTLTDRPRRLFVECSNAHPDDVKACIRAINAKVSVSMKA
jgi:hypothetical protein